MNSPEAYIQTAPRQITDNGEVTVESTEGFLCYYMTEFLTFTTRVRPVLPRDA